MTSATSPGRGAVGTRFPCLGAVDQRDVVSQGRDPRGTHDFLRSVRAPLGAKLLVAGEHRLVVAGLILVDGDQLTVLDDRHPSDRQLQLSAAIPSVAAKAVTVGDHAVITCQHLVALAAQIKLVEA